MALFTRNNTRTTRDQIQRISVVTLALGLFATVALPAYAATGENVSSRDLSGSQAVRVENEATVIGISAESYASSTASQARQEAAAAMSRYASSWTGPTVAELLANPPASRYDGNAIYQTALKYLGVPYVYGGDTPAGFDCSGYTMYVFAENGIALPHSATAQYSMGTPINEADAQPGDLIIINGHVGFWAGPGLILHAPYAGSSVRIQPAWSSYTVFRLGI